MSWQFYNAYADEAYAVLSSDFIAANGTASNGFDLQALQQDLAAIEGVSSSVASIFKRGSR
jgi:hypothetical protein